MLSSMSDNRSNYLVSVDVGRIHASAAWLNVHPVQKEPSPFELGESFPFGDLYELRSYSTSK
jgi:hypothetical protein